MDPSFRVRTDLIRTMCRENPPGGCTPHPRRTAQTRHRHRGEQRQQIDGALPQTPHLRPGESCCVPGPELLNKPLNKTEPTMPNKANGCRLPPL